MIVVDKSMRDPASGFLRGVKLRIEHAEGSAEELSESLGARLREKLNVRFDIEVLEPGALPRTVHKAKRVIKE